MQKPPHQKSVIEARYDKAWSAVGLKYAHLKEFIEAIKIGDLNKIASFVGPESTLNLEQKRALLTRSFNENDFNNTKGTSIKNAKSLAEKYENDPVGAYLAEQKKHLPSPWVQRGMGLHGYKPSIDEANEKNEKINPLKRKL